MHRALARRAVAPFSSWFQHTAVLFDNLQKLLSNLGGWSEELLPYTSNGGDMRTAGGDFGRELQLAAAELRTLRARHGDPALEQIVARAPQGQRLSPSGISAALRGHSLPSRDYYLTLVRVLLAYDANKIASLQHPEIPEWRDRWQRLSLLRHAQSNRAPAALPISSHAALSEQVVLAALRRGEHVQLPPTATELGGVWAMAFSPDGHLLATGHGAKTVQLWNTVEQRRAGPALFGHTDRVSSVAFSPDGRLLATGSHDGTARLWNVDSRTLVTEPLDSAGFVDSLLFTPDGQSLYVIGRSIRRWELTDPRRPRKAEKHFANGLTSAPVLSPDGLLITGHAGGLAQLWDAREQKKIDAPLRGHASDVTALALAPSGDVLATGSDDIQLWDLRTHQMMHEPLPCSGDTVTEMAFSQDGHLLVAISGDRVSGEPEEPDFSFNLWDTTTWTELPSPQIGHSGHVTASAFSPDSRLFATGGIDGLLRIRTLPTSNGG
ncbi:WD40 repeat domain-containing protein [Streptomyces sp. NPDC051064]|uniref:WD40 repeat domain-containing protein n=1 Tax=Streptomyces sp. NPDC051064 TaxID=3365641 RepID=UPI00379EF5C1